MPVILAFEGQSQEDDEFKASLGDLVRPRIMKPRDHGAA
jgi:hypothetical protein